MSYIFSICLKNVNTANKYSNVLFCKLLSKKSQFFMKKIRCTNLISEYNLYYTNLQSIWWPSITLHEPQHVQKYIYNI